MSLHSPSIHEFTPDWTDRWAEYVDGQPEATFFHGLGWKRAVERTFGHRGRYLLAEQDSRVVGVLPLFEINSLVAGRFLVSVPYATYGGIVADDHDAILALFEAAVRIGRRVRARSIELRSIKAAVPLLAATKSHVAFRKLLPERPDDVLSAFPRKARAAARRAAGRYDLSVEYRPDLLPVVWDLYCRSMRRLGSVNYPYQFFVELAAAFGDRCIVQVVRRRDRPVAGLLTFLHRDAVLPYFAGVDEREDIYGLNQYMYAESMRWGVERGYRVYDFGRTRADNHGCLEFKRLCGFEPQPLGYQVCVMPGEEAPDLAPTSPRWAMARRVWRTLPLPITRPLGGWLAKSIPG